MTLSAPAIPTRGTHRAFHRFAVSFWPTPDHRERVEIEVLVGADGLRVGLWLEGAKAEALRVGARELGRPADECCIGYLTTVTRRIDE